MVTRSTLLPLVVLVYPLLALVCPLIASACPLVVLAVVVSVGLFVTDLYFDGILQQIIKCPKR